MPAQLNEIKRALEQKVPAERRASLISEMPKAEAILANGLDQLREDDRSLCIRNYSLMSLLLNQQLATVCKLTGYDLDQAKWKDSMPLQILDSIYSNGLVSTEWYQNHLGEMLQPTNHPLTQLAITT